ncbi:hypothetical protein L0Y93_21665 [Burkholderia multivorans]|nr:hypothetical protein [Burkholderia multivorans]QET33544.1 hypothetical protein FOB31_28025 [Burkholderia multivorans]QET36656.1 hypothetical protein FOB30_02555 [Burkholderia multivorans]
MQHFIERFHRLVLHRSAGITHAGPAYTVPCKERAFRIPRFRAASAPPGMPPHHGGAAFAAKRRIDAPRSRTRACIAAGILQAR